MDKLIVESEMPFGPFKEDSLFHVEKSSVYRSLGEGVKTVEFVLRLHAKNDTFVFLEAKKSCPNSRNRFSSQEKREKYEEYYEDICQKVEDSLSLAVAVCLGRYGNVADMGRFLKSTPLDQVKLKFILVIKNAEMEWLSGVRAELEQRILSLRKIWKLDVIVLNYDLAIDAGLAQPAVHETEMV